MLKKHKVDISDQMSVEVKEKADNEFVNGLMVLYCIAFSALLVAACLYWFKFGAFSLNSSLAVWAEFGDYFSGVLNPIISFCALVALLITVHLQRKELANSSDELRKSSEALQQQADHIKTQTIIADIKSAIWQMEKIIDGVLQTVIDTKPHVEDLTLNDLILNGRVATKYRMNFHPLKAYEYAKKIPTSDNLSIARSIELSVTLSTNIKTLSGFLSEYDSHSASTLFSIIFREKYKDIVKQLEINGYIEQGYL